MPNKEICLCAFCRVMLHEGEPLADNEVYKLGKLNYIELAHEACAIKADPTGRSWKAIRQSKQLPNER